MFKKILTAAAVASLALGGMAISAPAQAREGAQSIGHGIKCYYYLGVRICYKGV